MWIRQVLSHFLAAAAIIVLGALLAGTLARFAPGFAVDEEELDARLSKASLLALREAHAGESNLVGFYIHYLAGIARGNLGVSSSLRRPVAGLLADRIPVTLNSIGLGLAAGWMLGLALALPAAMYRAPAYDLIATLLGGFFLCLPSGALALLFLFASAPVPLAIAVVAFPRIFRYARNILAQAYTLPHVLTARAKGLRDTRILIWHVLPAVAPQLAGLAGVSVSTAFAAAIPIEVICDSPGIGQLAWQAALGRDLPLLVNVAVFVTVLTLLSNSVSDLAISVWSTRLR